MNDNCLFFFWILLSWVSLRLVIGLGIEKRCIYESGLLLQYCMVSKTGINVSIDMEEQIMFGFYQGQIIQIHMREIARLSQNMEKESQLYCSILPVHEICNFDAEICPLCCIFFHRELQCSVIHICQINNPNFLIHQGQKL